MQGEGSPRAVHANRSSTRRRGRGRPRSPRRGGRRSDRRGDVAGLGSLTYREKVALTPAGGRDRHDHRHDRRPRRRRGHRPAGHQRPDAVPIDFSVLVDAATIDPTTRTRSSRRSSTVRPRGRTRRRPVITGGPTDGVDLTLTAVPQAPGAVIGGTIVPPARTTLDPSAVMIAALVKVETGTLVSRVVRPVDRTRPPRFSIGYDPTLIDPAATYVVKGGSSTEPPCGRTERA